MKRDAIEQRVAQAIREYALQDDVNAWIADSTLACNQRQGDQSHTAILVDELAGVKKSIKNLLAAIEQGIITDTTKGRLMELEAEQAGIAAKLAAKRTNIISIPLDASLVDDVEKGVALSDSHKLPFAPPDTA